MKKVLLACFIGLIFVTSAFAAWPERDITVIVPYPAGGGTDLTARMLVNEMQPMLGVNIVVINKPGASGSVGTVETWHKPHDGYTIVANGMLAFVNYPVLGFHDKTYKEWNIWIGTYSPNVIVTKAGGKYKTMNDLMATFRAAPGKLTCGTAGLGTGGHIGMEVLRAGTGVIYKHIPYEGGAKAVTAELSGEIDVLPQLSMEVADHIRAGKFVPLAALTDKDFTITGYNKPIPSVAFFEPKMKPLLPMGEAFGFMVPKDTPKEVVDKLNTAFKKAMQSPNLKKFADDKAVLLLGLYGKEADTYIDKLASIVSWILYEGGQAKISPEKFNIPKFKY